MIDVSSCDRTLLPWLRFTSLHLEGDYSCNYDSVKLYEGFDQVSEKLIGTFCGNHTSELPIRSTKGNTATVVFRTDASVTREGFALAVDFVHCKLFNLE